MKIFLDTANIDQIREANDWGVLDGVTTNPSLVAIYFDYDRQPVEQNTSMEGKTMKGEMCRLGNRRINELNRYLIGNGG